MSSLLSPENLVNALSLGALYALIAVGYTMVYGIIKLINFAHGEVFMLGAFWALLIVGMEQATGINLLVALVPAMLLCAAVGMNIDWTTYLPLRRELPRADILSIVLLVLLAIGAIFYKLTGDSLHRLYSETAHTVLGWGVVGLIPVVMLGLAVGEKGGLLGRSLGRISSDRLSALITAIGMSLMLQTLAQLIFGAEFRAFPEESIPEFMRTEVFDVWFLKSVPVAQGAEETTIAFASAPVLGKELAMWIAAVVMMIGLHLLVTRTKIGTAMRACSMDQETAALMGISVDRVIAFTFVIGSAMAAVAGVLYAVKQGGNIYHRMGYYPGLIAFAAAVLGGIGNIRGAMLGGVVIGIIQGFLGGSGNFTAPFLVMIIVLLVLPRGLLGEPQATRA